ncbi:MAG: hypothetical protein ACRDZY_00675, partial [Acidimicrobiales bacterium]
LDRMHAVHERSQVIGEFLDHGGYVLAQYRDDVTDETLCRRSGCSPEEPCGRGDCVGGYVAVTLDPGLYPVGRPIEDVLAEYFGIDLRKAEAERRAILDGLRRG